jgi:hypothetical protein
MYLPPTRVFTSKDVVVQQCIIKILQPNFGPETSMEYEVDLNSYLNVILLIQLIYDDLIEQLNDEEKGILYTQIININRNMITPQMIKTIQKVFRDILMVLPFTQTQPSIYVMVFRDRAKTFSDDLIQSDKRIRLLMSFLYTNNKRYPHMLELHIESLNDYYSIKALLAKLFSINKTVYDYIILVADDIIDNPLKSLDINYSRILFKILIDSKSGIYPNDKNIFRPKSFDRPMYRPMDNSPKKISNKKLMINYILIQVYPTILDQKDQKDQEDMMYKDISFMLDELFISDIDLYNKIFTQMMRKDHMDERDKIILKDKIEKLHLKKLMINYILIQVYGIILDQEDMMYEEVSFMLDELFISDIELYNRIFTQMMSKDHMDERYKIILKDKIYDTHHERYEQLSQAKLSQLSEESVPIESIQKIILKKKQNK